MQSYNIIWGGGGGGGGVIQKNNLDNTFVKIIFLNRYCQPWLGHKEMFLFRSAKTAFLTQNNRLTPRLLLMMKKCHNNKYLIGQRKILYIYMRGVRFKYQACSGLPPVIGYIYFIHLLA